MSTRRFATALTALSLRPAQALSSVLAVSTTMALTVALFALPDARAQEGEDEAGEAEAPADTGPRTITGRAEARGSVGQAGAIFELHNKARLVVPPGLPIGSSRGMRFAEERARFVPDHVADGFRRLGPILTFDAAINATRAPVVVSIRQPSDPARPNLRVVLAMEQPTICREGLDPVPHMANLCSSWELLETRYDATERRLSAELRTPGGYRLVFGTIPIPPPAEPAPTADDAL